MTAFDAITTGIPAHPAMSQCVRAGNLLFVSAQFALDGHKHVVGPGDCGRQTEQVFDRLRRILEAAGTGLEAVKMMTIYLVEQSDYPPFTEVRRRVFPQNPPATTTVIVKGFVLPELLVAVDAIAAVG